MITLRTPARHLGHLSRSWQFDWPEIKGNGPVPMNRQERESIVSQLRAELARNSPVSAKLGPADDPGSVGEVRKLLAYFNIPSVLHGPIIYFVAIGSALALMYAAWNPLSAPISSAYERIPFVRQIQKVDSEINDAKTGLPAISHGLDRSRAQLNNVTAFLVAKYPEFGNLILEDAEKAARNGNMNESAALLQMVASALGNTSVEPREGFFTTALETLNKIQRSSKNSDLVWLAFKTRIALAIYNSRLQPQPQIPTNRPLSISGTIVAKQSTPFSLKGRQVNWNGPSGGEFFTPSTVSEPGVVFGFLSDMTLMGGTQTLDNFAWTDVTFVNCVIKYHDGPLYLQDVKFINCEFDLSVPSVPGGNS
jgi:hypothetical protein